MTLLENSNDITGNASKVVAQDRFSHAELQALAASASSLDERLQDRSAFAPVADKAARAEKVFADWTHTVSGGDAQVFENVCKARGVDSRTDVALFGPVGGTGRDLPAWAATFEWVFDTLSLAPQAQDVARLANDPKRPFEELFYALVSEVRRRRDARVDPDMMGSFTTEGLDHLDRSLLQPLTDICVRALNDRFALSVQTQGYGGGLAAMLGGDALLDKVPGFVASFRATGLKQFFVERPVLARLIATLVEQWQVVTVEFIERLHADRLTRIVDLTGDADLGRVAEIGASLSDLHNEGRSVYQVTFESGTKVGYKPKSLDIDAAWASLIDWLDANGAPASAGTPDVAACGDYGWVEWVAPKDCETADEAAEFFRRSGATLCLIRALQGNDFHFENIIAQGPVPVPVDLETIMVARIKDDQEIEPEAEAMVAAYRSLEDSVFTSGYLPGWTSVPGGAAVLMGGLDAHETLASRAGGSEELKALGNVPNLNGVPLQVNDYGPELLAGYEAMFAYLQRHGTVIAADGGPLDVFEGLRFRSVLRATRLYGFLQHRALGRQSVVDGAAWSQNFDFLYRSSVTRDGAGPLAAVCHYETTCMAGYNVPFFEGTTDSTDLICGDGTVVPDFFRMPCLREIRERLADMADDLLEFDLMVIRQALSSTELDPNATGTARTPNADIAPVTTDQLIAAAQTIAGRVEKSAIRKSRSQTWMCLAPVTADERALQLQPLGNTFLTGTIGIAMLEAALYRVTGEEKHRVEAMAILDTTRHAVENIDTLRVMAKLAPLGLASGIGGVIYGLVTLADMLDEPSLLEAAKVFASLLDEERLKAEEDSSLSSGVAGALVGLIALYEKAPADRYRDLIAAGAAALIDARKEVPFGGKAWRDRTWRVSQVGLMHGASGIALALHRAGNLLEDSALHAAAQEAVAFESALLDRYGYWPDLRDLTTLKEDTTTKPALDYANGAAGIGLARLSMGDELAGADEGRAVTMLDAAPMEATDSVFSGQFGRLAFQAEMARTTDAPGLATKLGRETATVLQQADAAGSFAWRNGSDGQNPTLFAGSAGVGLALLRMARPDLVPNIWAFETGSTNAANAT
ncbi:type 2 lanthipeptide synthetase LanM family protein [Ruegeria jejuensis]|uniref:type 2 lanthipeptide synthetase LanM family protein n=1 Tax=Ruegeria jejuensis TaxID=3233338 RepID=UPI00355B24F3